MKQFKKRKSKEKPNLLKFQDGRWVFSSSIGDRSRDMGEEEKICEVRVMTRKKKIGNEGSLYKWHCP